MPIPDVARFARPLNLIEVDRCDRKAGSSSYTCNEIVLLDVIEVSEIWSPAYDIGRTEQELVEFYRSY